eukprot:2489484-Pleurochrysis_carterae.AAC.2
MLLETPSDANVFRARISEATRRFATLYGICDESRDSCLRVNKLHCFSLALASSLVSVYSLAHAHERARALALSLAFRCSVHCRE